MYVPGKNQAQGTLHNYRNMLITIFLQKLRVDNQGEDFLTRISALNFLLLEFEKVIDKCLNFFCSQLYKLIFFLLEQETVKCLDV